MEGESLTLKNSYYKKIKCYYFNYVVIKLSESKTMLTKSDFFKQQTTVGSKWVNL